MSKRLTPKDKQTIELAKQVEKGLRKVYRQPSWDLGLPDEDVNLLKAVKQENRAKARSGDVFDAFQRQANRVQAKRGTGVK